MNLAFLLAEPAGFAAGAVFLSRRSDVVGERRTSVVAGIAVASAVAAVAAGGSATGWRPLDVVLLAGAGAGAVLVGLLAEPLLILLAGVAGVVAGIGSSALPLALAATGIVLAAMVLEREPVAHAIATALVLQAALRLAHPSGRGLTALVAAGMLAPLVISAVARCSASQRRIVLRGAVAAAGLAVLGGLVGGVAALRAVRPLRRGTATVSGLVTPGTVAGVDVASTSAKLAAAGRDFAGARSALDAWWVRPAAVVPIVAQHWRVLRAAAVTGDDLAGAARRALDAPALADVKVTDGQVPLDQLAAIAGPVTRLADQVTAGRMRLQRARSAWLVAPLQGKLDTQLARLTKIERTTRSVARAVPLLPGLLGRDGPRRYFLAVVSPVELRAGGGFLGNFGEITAVDGRLSLTRFGRPMELNQAGGDQRNLIASPDFIARYSRFGPQLDWANINLSPDFPSDAEAIEAMYPQSGGEPIDGVISVDPSALAAILRVVGSIQVASWPTPITADNALQIMLYDQYLHYDNASRIDFLGDVAQEAWRRLTTGVLPAPTQVLAALGPSVRTKDVLLWSKHPAEQQFFEDVGAAGKVAPVRGDFVGLVTQNASGNKIDYFLRRAVDYRVRLDPTSGKLDATATVTLHNGAPASGLPPTIIGNELIPPLPDGQNKLYLSFYSPWDLVSATLDGSPLAMENAGELGRRVYSTGLVVLPGGDVTLELHLSGRLPKGRVYRLDVYREPTVAPDGFTASLLVSGDWQVPGGSRQWSGSRQLDTDAVIDVPLTRP